MLSSKWPRTRSFWAGCQAYLAVVLLADAFVTDSKILVVVLLGFSALNGWFGLQKFREAHRLDKEDAQTSWH